MNATEVIRLLNLEPLQLEGGYFVQTYKSTCSTQHPIKGGDRSTLTCIYYLMTQNENSKLHRVKSDEIFHYYLGAPAELLIIDSKHRVTLHVLGPNLLLGERPQIRVPANSWQSLKVKGSAPAAYCLMGATVSPGFEFEDFELGEPSIIQKTLHGSDTESQQLFTSFFNE